MCQQPTVSVQSAPAKEELMKTYSEFWPFYLTQHTGEATRRLHFLGTALALACLIAGFWTGQWLRYYVLMNVGGYGPAWVAHYFYEQNKPATFKYPWWSLASDYRMFFLWVFGRLDGHLRAAGIPTGKTRMSKHHPAPAVCQAEE